MVIKKAIHKVKALLSYAGIPLNHEFKTEYSYHYGIENNLIQEISSCTNNSLDTLNKSKLLESLNKNMPVDCKDATFKILGVSLAAINTILSILIVIISIRTLVYEANK